MTLFVLDAAKFLESISRLLCCEPFYAVRLFFYLTICYPNSPKDQVKLVDDRLPFVISHAHLVAHKLLDCCYCNVGCIAIIR